VLRPASSLEATEHDLDPVAAFIPALVVFDGLFAGLSARDAGGNPFFLQRIAEPVGVIAPITQQPLCLGRLSSKAAAPV
jgi:hypothetical protein